MKILLSILLLGIAGALGAGTLAERIQAVRIYPHQALTRLTNYLRQDPEAAVLREQMKKRTERFLATNEFVASPSPNSLESVDPEYCAFHYLLTGDPKLGKKLRAKFLDYAARPLTFYLEAKSSPWMYERRMATVGTGHMLQKLAISYDLCRTAFTEEERSAIESALKEKGLVPSLKYLGETRTTYNNWYAVIASGVYFTAKAIGDRESEEFAARSIQKYLASMIEADGSYGEGAHYLLYPVSVILKTAAGMSSESRAAIFASSALRFSPEYLAYCNLFQKWNGFWMRIQFRDGPQYARGLENTVLYSLGTIYPGGIITDYLKRTGMPEPLQNVSYLLLKFSAKSGATPETLEKLPGIRVFQNGECFIRSGWDGNALVLAMLSGGACRTGYTHDRPARNGIALGGYGEYFLVNPGLSNYLTPQRWEWEVNTRSHNVITIDRLNQLEQETRDGHNAENPLHRTGLPEARILFAASGKMLDILSSDAAKSYAAPLSAARRTVLFIRDPGYFIVLDHFAASEKHQYQSYFHFNNLDGKLVMTRITPLAWKLQRPLAGMWLYTLGAQKLNTTCTPTKLHWNFQPGTKMKTPPGTSMELEFATESPSKEFTQCTLLFPYPGEAAPEVRFSGTPENLEIQWNGRIDHLLCSSAEIRFVSQTGKEEFPMTK